MFSHIRVQYYFRLAKNREILNPLKHTYISCLSKTTNFFIRLREIIFEKIKKWGVKRRSKSDPASFEGSNPSTCKGRTQKKVTTFSTSRICQISSRCRRYGAYFLRHEGRLRETPQRRALSRITSRLSLSLRPHGSGAITFVVEAMRVGEKDLQPPKRITKGVGAEGGGGVFALAGAICLCTRRLSMNRGSITERAADSVR